MSTDDRRAAIEAAFEAATTDENTEGTETPQQAEVLAQESAGGQEAAPEQQAAGSEEAEPAQEQAPQGEVKPAENVAPTDDAPASWRAPVKSKWAGLDPEVRQEIQRRERETTKVLSESTNARQLASSLQEIVTPFAARFQALGISPLKAFQNLVQADYQLATGTKHQRAQLVAKLIKDYDVDVGELDGVLAGQTSPQARDEDRITRLLEQHLGPVKQKLQTYEQREQQAIHEQEAAFAQQIETMASTPKDYPHFDAVRDAMADLVEISARRGVTLDLKTAYNRAVAADPQLAAQVESARQAEAIKQAALKAQRAKAASSSVNGAPSGVAAKISAATDRRTTISAAFDALGN